MPHRTSPANDPRGRNVSVEFPLNYPGFVQAGNQVYAYVQSGLSEVPAAHPEGIAVAVSLYRPGEIGRKEPTYHSISPDQAARFVRDGIQLANRLSKIHLSDLQEAFQMDEFIRAIWFLDSYWPALQRGIGRILTECKWPSELHSRIRLFRSVHQDSMYMSLGVATIDAVQQALLGRQGSPLIYRLPTPPPTQPSHSMLLEQGEREREFEWWNRTAQWLFRLIPEAVERLNALGPIRQDALVACDRGILAELDAISHPELRLVPRKGSPAFPPLLDRQANALQALVDLKATDRESRRNRQQIAEAADGPGADGGSYARPLASLVKSGLVESCEGRGGGYWITTKGIKALNERTHNR